MRMDKKIAKTEGESVSSPTRKQTFWLAILVVILLLTMCACYKRGSFPAPIHQPLEDIVKVDIVDGRNELALYHSETYQDYVIYTLKPEEIAPFIEGLKTIEFFQPGWEPARDLGYLVVWIYYEDRNSDVIGIVCNRYFDPELNYLVYGIDYPDEESFYALVEQYVDPALLPRGWD